jgi:hypothetical protein
MPWMKGIHRKGLKMICNYCNSPVEILAYRLGEVMCLDCARSAYYQQMQDGNHKLMTAPKVGA